MVTPIARAGVQPAWLDIPWNRAPMTTSPFTLPVALAETREQRFVAFVEAHRDRALRLAWRLMDGDESAAEDVVQDALLRAHRGLGSFREDAELSTWFYRIVVRQAANHRRAAGTRLGALARWWNGAEPLHHSAPAPAADPGLRDEIRAALATLSPPQREVFVLVHLEQFTAREAADLLGVAPGTAKSHLHRAVTRLRAHLDAHRTPS